MRKISYLVCLVLFLAISCEKDEKTKTEEQFYENYAFSIDGETKGKIGSQLWTLKAGHSSTNCSGCVTTNGYTHHVDCQGVGNACTSKASVTLSLDSGNFYSATTIDEYVLTSEDFFLMPNRSLFVEMDGKVEVWLNIPGQLSIRDTISEQFTFNGLFYSNYAVYKNQ